MEKEFAWMDRVEANARKFDGEEIAETAEEEGEEEDAETEDED